jgi:hypothetical protein
MATEQEVTPKWREDTPEYVLLITPIGLKLASVLR